MKYGYARVSTDDQSSALQLAALKRAGCKTFFKDQGLSGATTKRPALLRCLKALQDGDTLIVWKLDRLGRSLRDLIAMLDDLMERGVKFGRKPKMTPQQVAHARKLIDQKDLDVRVENHTLTVRGERKFEADVKEQSFHRIERRYGSFFRAFTLPTTVDTENVAASYNAGVLKLELAKKPEAQPKQIRINVA
jgi:hypothetical protein